MKNVKFLSALLALLLCASVALTACGKKDEGVEEETETEATTEKAEGEGEEKQEPVTYKLADVMNKEWSLEKKKIFTANTATEFVGSSIRVSFDYNLNSMFFVTREENSEDANKDVTHVYNVVTGKEILKIEESLAENKVEDKTLKESNRPNENRDGYDRGNDGMNSVKTYKNGYVNVFTETHFAVLSITTVEDEHKSLSNTQNYANQSNMAPFECDLYNFYGVLSNNAYAKYTLTIYDAEGKAVKTIGEKEFEARCNGSIDGFKQTMYSELVEDYIPAKGGVNNAYMASDLLIDGTKVYRLDANGTSTLVKDFGLAKMPNFHSSNSYDFFMKIGEKYLEYCRYTDDDEYINQYTVYSKDLATEIIYNIPSIANSARVNLLANGNLLVQYSVTLNENEESYDFRSGATGKYDLKTFIITKDGATEIADVNCLIESVSASVTDINGQKIYADKIENLAFIYPIAEDKTLDTSANNVKLVALSNDLKTVNEVICADKLASFPYPVDDNTFRAVLTSGGVAYYNENGEKISVLNDFSVATSKYKYVEDDGIYDIKGAKVYDYKKNNTLGVEVCGESFVIKYLSYDENGAKENYALFVDGELKTIAGEVTDVLDFGVYAVDATVKKDDGTVVKNTAYYNEKGAPLGTFAGGKMACMLSGDGYAIFRSDTENKFYKFTAAVPEAK